LEPRIICKTLIFNYLQTSAPDGRIEAPASGRAGSAGKIFSAIAGNFRIFAGVWQQV
jgi:hypothetical protein